MANTKHDQYLPVVDVSVFQKRLDAPVMAAAGVRAVVARASDGTPRRGHAGEDAQWKPFVRAASSPDLLIGAYHFLRPQISGAAEQSRFYLQTVRGAVDAIGRPLDLPLMVDVEQYWKNVAPLPGPTMVRWLAEFLDVVENEGADLVRPGAATPSIYTGAPFWQAFVGNSDAFGRYGLVLARYPTYRLVKGANGKKFAVDHTPPAAATTWPAFAWNLRDDPSPRLPPGWDRWDGWQFSGDGNNGGAQVGVGSTHVDCNIFLADSIARWTGGQHHSPDTSPRPLVAGMVRNLTEEIVNSLPNVKPGASGEQVKRVQGLLLAAGFDPGPIDGDYPDDPNHPTFLAVRAFQAARGLVQDGKVGTKQTWPALLGV